MEENYGHYTIKLKELIKEFNLEVMFGPQDYEDVEIDCMDVSRPGLQLAGFFEHFDNKRIEIIGKVEMAYLSNLVEEKRIEMEHFPYIQQFVLWFKTYRPKVIFTERKLFGEKFAGTLDLICEIDGKIINVDYKFTSAIDKKSLSVQLEGYYRLCQENNIHIDESWYLHIKKDAFVFKPITRDSEWFDLLLAHNKKMRGKYNGK
jgi:hypothetical protein